MNNEIITYNVILQVKVRKYDVDIESLKILLRSHKTKTNKQLSDLLHIPLTQVEHYFRTDKYFAIPEPDIWFALKNILNITDNSFDKPITEFIIKPNMYDMGNRVYDERGIAPTILADSGDKMYLVYEE